MAVRDHRFSVAGATQNDTSFAFPSGYRACCRPDESGIVHRIGGIGSEVAYFMSPFPE